MSRGNRLRVGTAVAIRKCGQRYSQPSTFARLASLLNRVGRPIGRVRVLAEEANSRSFPLGMCLDTV